MTECARPLARVYGNGILNVESRKQTASASRAFPLRFSKENTHGTLLLFPLRALVASRTHIHTHTYNIHITQLKQMCALGCGCLAAVCVDAKNACRRGRLRRVVCGGAQLNSILHCTLARNEWRLEVSRTPDTFLQHEHGDIGNSAQSYRANTYRP